MVEVLTMADMEEQDRRHFALAVKSDDPVKTYTEIKQAVETALTPQPKVDDLPAERSGWLRKT